MSPKDQRGGLSDGFRPKGAAQTREDRSFAEGWRHPRIVGVLVRREGQRLPHSRRSIGTSERSQQRVSELSEPRDRWPLCRPDCDAPKTLAHPYAAGIWNEQSAHPSGSMRTSSQGHLPSRIHVYGQAPAPHPASNCVATLAGLRYSLVVHPMLRLLLICLLAIALPLKAVASVAMVGCGPVHHGAHSGGEAAAAASSHTHGSHGGSDAPAGEHAPAPGNEPGGTAHGDKHHGSKLSAAKCSSCAPCCAAVAPAPDSRGFAALAPAATALPFATSSYRGVVGDVPHKPPRLFLA